MSLLASMLLPLLLQIIFTNGLGYDDVGCFPKSALTGLSSQGTYQYQSTGYCEGLCEGQLVIALTNGNECFCGTGIDKSAGVSSSFCSASCAGYPQDNCGSNDSNYFHVILDAVLNSELSDSLSSTVATSSTHTPSTSSTSTSTSTSPTTSTSTSTSTSTASSLITITKISTSTSTSSTSSSAIASSITSESGTERLTETSAPLQESSVTTVLSSESVFTSNEQLITIVHSVTSVSIQTQTATAIRTATVAPSLSESGGISTNNKSSNTGLSHGAIAGIVVGVVIGTLLISAFLLWFFGVTLFCLPGRKRGFDEYDNEKSIRDDSLSLHHPVDNTAALAGLEGFGRTAAYEYNADEISIGYGNRRFSQGSLPDAAGGSESDSSHKAGGLRVINPDV